MQRSEIALIAILILLILAGTGYQTYRGCAENRRGDYHPSGNHSFWQAICNSTYIRI